MQKNPAVRTVVNKLDKVDNTYRTFDMELIAGDDDYIAKLVSHASRAPIHYPTRSNALTDMWIHAER